MAHQCWKILGIPVSKALGNYLGLPSMVEKSYARVFTYIKERVWTKIKGVEGEVIL